MAYTAKDLRIQPVGFVFNAETYLRSVLPAGWDEKRLLSIKNNTIEETQLLTQALGNMRAMGLTNMADVRTSIKDFSKKYGTGLADTKNQLNFHMDRTYCETGLKVHCYMIMLSK